MRISDWSSDVCSSDLFAARDSTSEAAPVSVPLDRGDDFQGAGCLNRRADHRPESSRRFRHRGPRASLRPSHGCSGSANEEERSDEHTSELQSLMRTSYAVFCLQKKITPQTTKQQDNFIT